MIQKCEKRFCQAMSDSKLETRISYISFLNGDVLSFSKIMRVILILFI